MECLPCTHCTLSCSVKVFIASVNGRESVPRQLVGELGPEKDTSGKELSASPGGNPSNPAFCGYNPSAVALRIGTQMRANPKLSWLRRFGLITAVYLAEAVVGISSTSRVLAYGSGNVPPR